EALVHVAMVVSGTTAAAVAAFAYYFLPISLEQYLQLQVIVPAALLVALGGMALYTHRARRTIDAYLRGPRRAAERDPGESGAGSGEPSATSVYRRGQGLPYRLALAHLALWVVTGLAAAWSARRQLGFEVDDTFLMLGIWIDIALGGAIFQ